MTPRGGSNGLGVRPLLSSVFLRAQSDERLSALAQGGNRHAFAVIFERYVSELRAHAVRIVRADRVEDVVQQAMLSSWSALLDGVEVVEVRAWLHRIVHNAALSTITKRGYNDGEIPASTAAPALTEDLAAGRLSLAEALSALARLPESQRAALTLTAFEGHSGSQAAHAMGLSENAFRQLVHRARSSMRSAVSAITPLPLLNWVTGGSGASAAGVGVGGLATAAKIAAVVVVTGTGIGLTSASHTHPHSSNVGVHNHRGKRSRETQDRASALTSRPQPSPRTSFESRAPQLARGATQHGTSSRRGHNQTGSHQSNQDHSSGRLSSPFRGSTQVGQTPSRRSLHGDGNHSQASGSETRPQPNGTPSAPGDGTPDSTDQPNNAPTSNAAAASDPTDPPSDTPAPQDIAAPDSNP